MTSQTGPGMGYDWICIHGLTTNENVYKKKTRNVSMHICRGNSFSVKQGGHNIDHQQCLHLSFSPTLSVNDKL